MEYGRLANAAVDSVTSTGQQSSSLRIPVDAAPGAALIDTPQTTNDVVRKVACRRCGVLILPTTATRFSGKCAPCGQRAGRIWREWTELTLTLPLLLVILPFAMLRRGLGWLYKEVSRFVPGSKENLKTRMLGGWTADWLTIKRVWSSAPAVFNGPVGGSAEITLEYLMLRQVSQDHTIASFEIAEAIDGSFPVLSAYCILALSERGEDEVLASLPPESLESDATFRLRAGCLGARQTLREFCKRRVPQH